MDVGSQPRHAASTSISPAVRINAAVAAAAVSASVKEDANVLRLDHVADLEEHVESPPQELVQGSRKLPLKLRKSPRLHPEVLRGNRL